MIQRIIRLAGCLALLAAAVPAAASAASDPALTVSQSKLDKALTCAGTLAGAQSDPVLLVHATFADPTLNWSWNYQETLPAMGRPACAVALANRGAADMQISSQYVVHAIRKMARDSGRKVAIIGHSQGGLEPRWALRWWPSLRRKVSDVITFGSPHHGTLFTDSHCGSPGSCAASLYQMRRDSAFLRALNRGRVTFAGVPFTAVWTSNDQFVTPVRSVAKLRGASNIGVQQLCPGRYVDHATMAFDAVTFAIAMDAINNAGPAKASRVDRAACQQETMPGVTREEGNAKLQEAILVVLKALRPGGPRAKREPRLACYVRGRCK